MPVLSTCIRFTITWMFMRAAHLWRSLAASAASGLERLPAGLFTLKFRLMALITTLLLVVVGLPVALFVHHLDRNYNTFSTTMLDITTLFVYQHIYDGLMANDSLVIQQNLELLAGDPRIRRVRIHEPQGRIRYSSAPDEINRFVTELADGGTLVAGAPSAITYVREGNTYASRHPIYVEDACTACHEQPGATVGYVDVVASFTDSAQIYSYAKHLSVSGGILIILVLWLAINLLYESQIERRLLRILRAFDVLARGRFDTRIEMAGRHELAVLADRFNETVRTLDRARQREDQLHQEQLERADRLVTLGEIAAEIAHEVNNPTGIIRARAEFVHDEMEARDPNAACLEDVDAIVQQTERIADITRSILHYARKHPRSFEPTDVSSVIRHAVKILQPRFKKQHVTAELRLPDEPATVWGNFSQLEQVFCNLINNSLDVLQHDGHVTFDVRPATSGFGRPIYRVTYGDDGPGIPPRIRKEIFSPFFTTKKDGKGTGLGLFIARNIITGHGGTLTLDPDVDRGAHFIIELEQYHG